MLILISIPEEFSVANNSIFKNMRNVFFVKKVKGLLQNVVSMGVSRDITSNVQEEFNAKCSFLSNLIINKISIFVFVYYTLKAKV